MKKRMEVIFTGRVQGVGFRFTASSIARKFPVTGFVRNLSDGNVELVAEGEEEILKNFLAAIRTSQMSDNIRGVDSGWKQPENVFKAFSIEA